MLDGLAGVMERYLERTYSLLKHSAGKACFVDRSDLAQLRRAFLFPLAICPSLLDA
jgi:hypothetical protein